MSIYQRINGADWHNVFVVGDLHGCHTLLMNELDKLPMQTTTSFLMLT